MVADLGPDPRLLREGVEPLFAVLQLFVERCAAVLGLATGTRVPREGLLVELEFCSERCATPLGLSTGTHLVRPC